MSSATAPGGSAPRLGRTNISSGRVARTRHRRCDVGEGLCTTNARGGKCQPRASSATAHDNDVWVEGRVREGGGRCQRMGVGVGSRRQTRLGRVRSSRVDDDGTGRRNTWTVRLRGADASVRVGEGGRGASGRGRWGLAHLRGHERGHGVGVGEDRRGWGWGRGAQGRPGVRVVVREGDNCRIVGRPRGLGGWRRWRRRRGRDVGGSRRPGRFLGGLLPRGEETHG